MSAALGLRNAFVGLKLGGAKEMLDRVKTEGSASVLLPDGADAAHILRVLEHRGVAAHVHSEGRLSVSALVSVLRDYPPTLTVGELIGVLETTGAQVRAGVLVIGGEW